MFFKTVLAATLLFTGLSAAQKSDRRTEAAVKKAMEKEKKYAREQKFYGADEYDFKGAEIDPDSLKGIEPVEPDYNHTMDWGACDSE